MWFKKKRLVAVTLDRAELQLMRTAMLDFRNQVLQAGKPTEDIDALLLRIMR